MNPPVTFIIDLNKQFKQLPNAPIVEAVIQLQATPTQKVEQQSLQTELKQRFSQFTTHTQHGLEAGIAGSAQGLEFHQRTRWDGFRLTSEDQKHVCQFKPNTVVFSRLSPYEGWDTFRQAASPFLQFFLELTAPNAIERIGVRFISQVKLKDGETVSDYVDRAPEPLERIGLDSQAFFHQDSFAVPGYPFRLNLARTIQLPVPPLIQKTLIVDIDVSTTDTTPLESVETRLQEMRFIKNEVFFSYMKDAETKFD